MTANWILTALIPLSLMLVVGLIVLSGSLSSATTALWAWRGVDAYANQDWVWVGVSLALIALTAQTGMRLWRRPVRPDGTRT